MTPQEARRGQWQTTAEFNTQDHEILACFHAEVMRTLRGVRVSACREASQHTRRGAACYSDNAVFLRCFIFFGPPRVVVSGIFQKQAEVAAVKQEASSDEDEDEEESGASNEGDGSDEGESEEESSDEENEVRCQAVPCL